MDQSIIELKKYIDNLVPTAKNAVLSPEWRKRVGQISQKYSLKPEQISSLEYEVLFVLIGMEPEEDLATNIETELKVSKILATQLADEINARIFQYIAKMVEDGSKQKAVSNKVAEIEQSKPAAPIASAAKIPESKLLSEIEIMAETDTSSLQKAVGNMGNAIKQNAPMQATKGEPPTNLPGMVEDSSWQNAVGNKEVENTQPKSAPSVFESKIMTSKPATSIETKPNPIVAPVKPPIGEKVDSQQIVVNSKSGSIQEKSPQTESPIKKTYVVDPYREPIE